MSSARVEGKLPNCRLAVQQILACIFLSLLSSVSLLCRIAEREDPRLREASEHAQSL